MPPGTPYNSFVLPYSIRVDGFTELPSDCPIIPTLHLLTHTHIDHITGLSSKSFGYTVICSPDAKEMLLRHEVYAERNLYQQELRNEKKRTFAHLKVDPLKQFDGRIYCTGSRDLLKPVPLNTPTPFELSGNETVIITLLDANHCPGAVMFLIEGPRGAVLHTGDLRVEPWFLESLTKNPSLRPYLANSPVQAKGTLDAIFLDTACVWSTLVPPTKQCATSGMVELIQMYAPTVCFFLNVWTWGYEDILRAVANSFATQIHVDRYKHSILSHISDPILPTIITTDPSCTRFHACERFDRCENVNKQGSEVVYVNPVMMGCSAWDAYLVDMKKKLQAGEKIQTLLVPIWRHSPLSELQSFVDLFRPHRVVPNTLEPALGGLDWLCIHGMFKNHLSPDGKAIVNVIEESVTSHIHGDLDVMLASWVVGVGEAEVVVLGNLEGGEDAKQIARRWTVPDVRGIRKLRMMREYLVGRLRDAIDRLLEQIDGEEKKQTANQRDPKRAKTWANVGGYPRAEERSDEDTDDDDERGQTAHQLFAADIMRFSSSEPQVDILTEKKNLIPKRGLLPTPVTNPCLARQLSTPVPFTPQHIAPRQSRVNSPCNTLSPPKTVDHGGFIRHKMSLAVSTKPEPFDSHSVAIPPSNFKKRALVQSSTAETDDSPKRACVNDNSDASYNVKMPVSPRTVARRQKRREDKIERNRIAERLSLARPDLVVPSYTVQLNKDLSCVSRNRQPAE